MKTTAGILLLLFSAISACAQIYFVQVSSKKDAFAFELANVLNNGNHQFNQNKFKPINNKIEGYTVDAHLFQLKKLLPGARNGLYVAEKNQVWLNYTFATMLTETEGLEYIKQLTTKIYKALNRKIVIVNGELDEGKTVVFEKKIAYAVNNGFFDFNLFLRLVKPEGDSACRVILHIQPPKPVFYYWVMKQQPIGSFNMALSVKAGMHLIHSTNEQGCPIDIMPFTCEGKRSHNDTVFYTYGKSGFDGLPNAMSEYQAAFDNLKSAMGSGYVYYLQKKNSTIDSKVVFAKFSDITKESYPIVTMQLQKNNSISAFSNQQYKIVLEFVMPGY